MSCDVKRIYKMETDMNPEVTKSTEGVVQNDVEEDYLVKSIGAFGPWQAGMCFIASITRYTAMTNMFSILFLTPVTEFICVDFDGNVTTKAENCTCYKNCTRYKFRKDFFDNTLTSEFELICDRMWMEGFTQTVLMFGFLLGVSLFGWISDRFGRRVAFLLSSFSNISFMIAAPFSPNYWIFTSIRFLVGLASGGVMVIGIVYILETVGSKYREIAGTLTLLPDGLAEVSLSAIAYFSPNWRVYLLGYCFVSIVITFLVLFLPETPRWYISKGKVDEAVKILTKAAKRNNMSTTYIEENVHIALEELDSINLMHRVTYNDLFKKRNLLLRTISSVLIWTSCGVCFFGINQYITFLGTDIFISVILLGFIQTPILPFAIIINRAFGRKPCIIGSLLITCIAMTALIFLEHGHWLCTVIGLIGLAAICTTFAVLYVYVSELFPTSLRNMAYGVCSAGAKVGAMVAPYIVLLSPQWMPSLVFAIVPLMALLFCVMLPETKGRRLKDSIE